MPEEPELRLDVETDGRARVITVVGELTFDTAAALRGAFADPIAETAVVIDLADVGFMDSTGLAALLYARTRAMEDGWTLTLRRPRPNVASLLRVTAVDTLLTIEG